MKCGYSERDIALYIEGDVPPGQVRDIQGHLANCPSCSDLAADLRVSQSILKGLRQEAISPAALSSVRARVLAKIDGTRFRWTWGRWVYAVAGGVFVVAIAVGVASQMQEPKAGAQQIVVIDPLPPPAAVPPSRGTITITTTQDSTVAVHASKGKGRGRDRREGMGSVSVNVPLREGDGSRRRQGVAQDESLTEPVKPLMVKLLTDDPAVVIYWLVDQKDGGTL